MTTTLDAIAGTLTAPAALTLAPPFWCIWAPNTTAATYLREDLIDFGCHFGVETWPIDGPALFIVYDESAREVCAKYGLFFRCDTHLDIMGHWEEHRAC